jgi:uncharacterized repeat protein (TIGR02543 family)
MSNFGSGSNSNGNFWYGNATNFPGFLYKKNLGVGGRRSTKMAPGGNTTCNSSTDLYNKYKPGGGGVGASSTANRRAKNRLASVCGSSNKCFPCYNTLGQYSNYTHNPNGFVPCPAVTTSSSVTPTPGPSGTYTVRYFSNEVPDTTLTGTVPTDTNSPYASGSSVTILGNTGTLQLEEMISGRLRPSFYRFGGWNTAPDGSGTNYVGGSTFNITANTDLYANWIIGPLLVYNSNAVGGSGTAPASSNTSYPQFSNVDIVGNTGSFSNGSLQFDGWNTAADGSGTSYRAGSQYTMPGGNAFVTVNLYAQWINPIAPASIPLTYKANSAFGGIGTDVSNNYIQNSTADISGNTFPVPFRNDGSNNTFYGWNTDASGNGTSYPLGSTITMNTSKTLFAQWGSSSILTVTYNKNGATTGSDASYNYPGGVQVPILGQGSLTRPGYTFMGWNTDASGNGIPYTTGYTFTSKNITLYALWAPGSSVKSCGGVGGPTTGTFGYSYPFAQVIKSTDTITIYSTLLFGQTATTYGSGNGPEGLISRTSNTVITYKNITINTNTSYAATDPSYNYAPYNYSKTITNDASGCIYWPSGATISSVTTPTISNARNSLPVTYRLSTRSTTNGCSLDVLTGGGTFFPAALDIIFINQAITLKYSNGKNTIFVTSPNASFYRLNTTTGPNTFTTTPTTYTPYAGITPRSSAFLTAITIIPSTASEYTYPPMPDYTVEYNANGATDGQIPSPRYFEPYNSDTTKATNPNPAQSNNFPYTVPGNIGTGTASPNILTKSTAPSTFSKWNTKADGTGTDYGPGTANPTYNPNSPPGGTSLILYAIWVLP